MEESTIPVIVWVGPAGARAASAGTFMTLAANLAYMAPSTEIGAASPVDQNGNDITGTEGQKVKQDAEAYITSIAQLRGKNVQWAVSTVESAVSSPASQAVAIHAVDGMAATIDDVLASANGQTVTVRAGQSVTLDLAGAQVVPAGMNPIQDLLHLLSDPNIAFVLFTIGLYGLIFEVIHPNFATGIAGSLSIILALIGFGSLPLNAGGLLLVALGIGLLVVDLHVTSHGLLTIGGIVSFVLGASALYAAPSSPTGPDVSVAYPLIATMVAVSLAFMLVVLRTVIRHRRRLSLRLPIYGAGGTSRVPNGTPAEVRSPLDPTGTVFAAGEEWSATTAAARGGPAVGSATTSVPTPQPIPRGARVTVVGQQGLTLIVEPDPASGRVS
jgi:membrane-bound serine protease (ClpP class)